LATGLLPPGIFESWFGIMPARTIIFATNLDVFEVLATELKVIQHGVPGRPAPLKRKKADVAEHPEALHHVGLLGNEPPGCNRTALI
jgi:hypothetical protein